MNPEASEINLIEQAQQGNRNAFGELARRHYDGTVEVVYRMCGDAQIAEDATQEAFVRAWLKLPSYQPRAPFRHWLYRIAINTARDALRRKPAENLDEAHPMLLRDATPGPEAALLQKEQAELVQSAVDALPEAARSVLVLREYGGLSYREIASTLEIPLGTVMSRLNYARSRLRAMLAETQPELEVEGCYA